MRKSNFSKHELMPRIQFQYFQMENPNFCAIFVKLNFLKSCKSGGKKNCLHCKYSFVLLVQWNLGDKNGVKSREFHSGSIILQKTLAEKASKMASHSRGLLFAIWLYYLCLTFKCKKMKIVSKCFKLKQLFP